MLYPLSYEDICGCCLSSHLLIIYDFFCFVTSLCRIIDIPLHPDNALESSSDLRFSVEIFPIDADIKLQIVAAEFHHADFFLGQLILPDRKLDNLSQDRILVALYAVGHKVGIHDAEHIF